MCHKVIVDKILVTTETVMFPSIQPHVKYNWHTHLLRSIHLGKIYTFVLGPSPLHSSGFLHIDIQITGLYHSMIPVQSIGGAVKVINQ